MKNNKILTTLTIILAILVITIGSYIIYDNFIIDNNNLANNNNNNDISNNTENTYTYNNIAGVYSALVTFDDPNSEEDNANFTLSLSNNGTFEYVRSQHAPIGIIGNYIIDGNKIVLNYWFNNASGTDLWVTEGTKTLTIDSSTNITDNNPKYSEYGLTKVTLSKQNQPPNIYLKEVLNNGFCSENQCIENPNM